jgi:hypothetical protein
MLRINASNATNLSERSVTAFFNATQLNASGAAISLPSSQAQSVSVTSDPLPQTFT